MTIQSIDLLKAQARKLAEIQTGPGGRMVLAPLLLALDAAEETFFMVEGRPGFNLTREGQAPPNARLMATCVHRKGKLGAPIKTAHDSSPEPWADYVLEAFRQLTEDRKIRVGTINYPALIIDSPLNLGLGGRGTVERSLLTRGRCLKFGLGDEELLISHLDPFVYFASQIALANAAYRLKQGARVEERLLRCFEFGDESLSHFNEIQVAVRQMMEAQRSG